MIDRSPPAVIVEGMIAMPSLDQQMIELRDWIVLQFSEEARRYVRNQMIIEELKRVSGCTPLMLNRYPVSRE